LPLLHDFNHAGRHITDIGQHMEDEVNAAECLMRHSGVKTGKGLDLFHAAPESLTGS